MNKKLHCTIRKSECCGCSACMAVCPQRAITMSEDEEGFLYPFIDEMKCVQCHLCILTCPNNKQNKTLHKKYRNPKE